MTMQPKTLCAYRQLVCDTADRFADGEQITARELPALTDDDMSVILLHESGISADACRPDKEAEIYNSVVHSTHEERVAALGKLRDDALTFEARDYLCGNVNDELMSRDLSRDEPDMPATEAPWEMHGDQVAFL